MNHESFLKTIIAHPDEDGPRLVYADWLDEYGATEHERARAEFIRLQCRYDSMARYSPERYDLEERATELLDRYADDWHDGVPTWAQFKREQPASGSKFRRGFLHGAACPAAEFFEHPGRLFAAAPIRELKLREIRDGGEALVGWRGFSNLQSMELNFCETPADVRSLLAAPCLTRLHGLELHFYLQHPTIPIYESQSMLGDDDARAIAHAKDLSCLTSLGLSVNRIGPDGIQHLVSSPYLSRIEKLDVSCNPVGDEGLRRLAESGLVERLTSLDIWGTGIGNEGMEALARTRPDALRFLKLGAYPTCRVGVRGLQALLQCPGLISLRELDLDSWQLNVGLVKTLASSPFLNHLHELHLAGTGLNDRMAMELASSPYLRNVRYLDLQNNRIGHRGIGALCRSPVLASVTYLVLYNNRPMGDRAAVAIARSPHVKEIRDLCLVHTNLGPEGTRALAFSRRLPELRTLDLQSNLIGDEGGRALCESPFFDKLRSLTLYNCGISEHVKVALRKRFGPALRIEDETAKPMQDICE